MPSAVFNVEIGAIAVVVGAFGAIMGIGGGLLLVPILIVLFGVETENARLASLVAVCVTSAAGSFVYLKDDAVDLRKASFLQLPTALGAVLGATLGNLLSDNMIRLGFAVFLLTTAAKMIFERVNDGTASNSDVTHQKWLLAAAACVAAGFVSGVLGVGGGIVFVPVLSLLLSKTPREAAATSTYLIGLTGAASALIYLQRYDDAASQAALLAVTIPSAIGIMIGAKIGASVSGLIRSQQLRGAFVLVMVANAGLLIWKVVSG